MLSLWADDDYDDANDDDQQRRRRQADEDRQREWYERQRRITADHEAAHRRVAMDLGIKPARTTINDDLSGVGGGGYYDGDWGPFNDAVVALAGAEGCGSHEGADDDWARARAGVRAAGRSMGEAQAEARRRVRAQASAIRRDANVLYSRGWL